jgi:hypothetical protein
MSELITILTFIVFIAALFSFGLGRYKEKK